MNLQDHKLNADQYALLYRRAFACLDDATRQLEEAMQELERLHLALGETAHPAGLLTALPMQPSEPDRP